MPTNKNPALRKNSRSPRGLTLLEVLLALAIFVAGLAALGQLVSSGVRGAVYTRLESEAAIRCETILSEIAAGVLPLESAEGVFEDDDAWSWQAGLSLTQAADLYLVEVTVRREAGAAARDVEFTLARYVLDPAIYAETETAFIRPPKREALQRGTENALANLSRTNGQSGVLRSGGGP